MVSPVRIWVLQINRKVTSHENRYEGFGSNAAAIRVSVVAEHRKKADESLISGRLFVDWLERAIRMLAMLLEQKRCCPEGTTSPDGSGPTDQSR
jgi:hypothetical protein